jgi:hypothetical protein
MKKKLLIGLGLLLAIVAIVVIAVPENRLSILGYFRGENRYQGRPTSYWRYKVASYAAQKERSRVVNIAPRAITTSFWDKVLEFLSLSSKPGAPEKPKVLAGGSEALPVLADFIKNKESRQVSLEAYAALATLGQPNAREVLPLLEEEIGGQDLYFRPVAVRTLASLGQDGIIHLIDGLEHEAPDVRQAAAKALYEMALGPQETMPKAAVPALVTALEDKVEGVRYYAAMALLHIDPEEAKRRNAERFPLEHGLDQTSSSKAAGDGAP